MITLKTLSQATEQEVFDQVAEHLLKQKQKSEIIDDTGTSRGCRYKTSGDLKCAAGCLISDDEYNEKMEGLEWGGLVMRGVVPATHDVLIDKLQFIHDSNFINEWKYALQNLAESYKLEWKFN